MRLNLQSLQTTTIAAGLLAPACAPEAGTTTAEATTDATTTSEADTTDASATSTGPGTSTAPTTGDVDPSTGTATGEATASGTTGEASEYCWGFDVAAPAPFLELYDPAQNQLGEGAVLPLECGGQGAWMFGLYPRFGGYEPAADWVTFAVTVDVAGYDINPAGHFFSGDVAYSLSCEPVLGGVLGVVPILPPDELPDLSLLDGLPASVHVEIDAAGQPLVFDATMTLSAPKSLTEQGCEFG